MLDYPLDVAPLLEAGLSNAEAAAHLSAKTSGPIQCSDARQVLFESGAVIEDPVTRVRSGSLIDYYSGLPDGADKSLLGWFISHCETGDEIGTDQYPRSVQWSSVVASMPDAIKSVASKLIVSAGGLAYGSVSEEDISESLVEHENNVQLIKNNDDLVALKARIENEYINPAISSGTPVEIVLSEIRAGL